MSHGRVYALSREEIEGQEDRALVMHQMDRVGELRAALKYLKVVVERMDFELGWPTKHFDQATTIETINDLMPTQTMKDMELASEVRRAEMRAAERNGQ